MFRLISHKVFLVAFSLLVGGASCFSACTSKKIYPTSSERRSVASSSAVININTADVSQLEKLPLIGQGLAMKIVEHRDRHGPFREPQHLLMVDGISEKRFREIRHLITVE